MPFLLLLLLTMVCLVDPWPEPLVRFGPREATGLAIAWSFLFTCATVATQGGLAAALARWTATKLHLFPEEREQTLRRHARLRHYLLLALIGGYTLILWGWGWGWAVQTLGASQGGGLPGLELLTLAPLLAGLVVSWATLYEADKALHETAPAPTRGEFFAGRWAYLSFQLRQNLALILVPLLLLILEKGLSRRWPGIHEGGAYQLGAIVVLSAAFIGLPWIFRLVLGLRPLADGPLRDRLLAASGRYGFRCSDILRWDTRGAAANALVAGVLPHPRYVILTDKLIAELTPDEVEAVFGHEVGHIRHRHMLYYLIFMFLSVGALGGVWHATAQWLLPAGRGAPGPAWLNQALVSGGLGLAPFVVLLGTYVFIVFGFLSRRCERQADLFGCRVVSCGRGDCAGHYTDEHALPRGVGLCATGIRTFVSALEKVAFHNGISRDRPGWLQSWQHSTIARRVDFLQEVLANPGLERRFQWRVLLVKGGLLLALAGLAALLWFWPLLVGPGGGAFFSG